jgi:translation initiation factor 2B subunit (eIF-2B alpha/beta/delta family)
MNIAELKGEKTVKTLAKRLLAEPSKDTPETSQAEMEAALLRLNPQLSQIRDLDKGTPILVPDKFGLAAEESFPPARGLADELLRQGEEAVSRLRAVLQERTARSAEENDRVQTWLKSNRAKEFLRRAPALEKQFASAAAAAKSLPKEQAAAVAKEDKALQKVQAGLAKFRSESPK